MYKNLLFGLFVLLHSGLAGAEPALRLHGSNTIGATLAPALVEKWLASRGFLRVARTEQAPQEWLIKARTEDGKTLEVEIHSHGSSTAFAHLGKGGADVGMASRPIKPREVEALAKLGRLNGSGSEYVLGLDGIAVIVNSGNPLDVLDKDSVARLFSGEVRDWSEVGGPPGPVRVFARDDKSGTYDTFKSLVLGKAPLAAGAQRYESSEGLSDAVAADPNGIGFIGLPYVRSAKALAISESGTRPIAPGQFSVATEDYALARRLFLYLPENAAALARGFADFAVGPEGQVLVDGEGFVSQRIISEKPDPFPSAPEEYRELTRGAERLSLNFRFVEGSVAADNKAIRDLERLVAYLARPENARRRLLLLGFADSHEVIPVRSLDLSVHRADVIADLLIARGISPMHVRGYGEAMPVATNETLHGRRKNRRVEVWLH